MEEEGKEEALFQTLLCAGHLEIPEMQAFFSLFLLFFLLFLFLKKEKGLQRSLERRRKGMPKARCKNSRSIVGT